MFGFTSQEILKVFIVLSASLLHINKQASIEFRLPLAVQGWNGAAVKLHVQQNEKKSNELTDQLVTILNILSFAKIKYAFPSLPYPISA